MEPVAHMSGKGGKYQTGVKTGATITVYNCGIIFDKFMLDEMPYRELNAHGWEYLNSEFNKQAVIKIKEKKLIEFACRMTTKDL